jgi:hypothetical protein
VRIVSPNQRRLEPRQPAFGVSQWEHVQCRAAEADIALGLGVGVGGGGRLGEGGGDRGDDGGERVGGEVGHLVRFFLTRFGAGGRGEGTTESQRKSQRREGKG